MLSRTCCLISSLAGIELTLALIKLMSSVFNLAPDTMRLAKSSDQRLLAIAAFCSLVNIVKC